MPRTYTTTWPQCRSLGQSGCLFRSGHLLSTLRYWTENHKRNLGNNFDYRNQTRIRSQKGPIFAHLLNFRWDRLKVASLLWHGIVDNLVQKCELGQPEALLIVRRYSFGCIKTKIRDDLQNWKRKMWNWKKVRTLHVHVLFYLLLHDSDSARNREALAF